MSLKCGIVGLPNVGKSTLFNALTAAGIEAQNFPFCTIEPNKGIVAVPDPRLNKIADIVNPEKLIPKLIYNIINNNYFSVQSQSGINKNTYLCLTNHTNIKMINSAQRIDLLIRKETV